MDRMTQNLISGQPWTFGGNLVEKAKESTEIKTFEKNCDEISFAKENYQRKKN
jgi:hypothetical protein